MTNTNIHSAARRLARYRVALAALVALTVVGLSVVPAELFGHGVHDPAAVFFAVGVLVAWGVACSTTLIAGDRLRNAR